jgi:23S rRNA pseudouridine1911/1915/1917 synthase
LRHNLNAANDLATLEIDDYYFPARFITERSIRAHDQTIAIDTCLDYGTTDRQRYNCFVKTIGSAGAGNLGNLIHHAIDEQAETGDDEQAHEDDQNLDRLHDGEQDPKERDGMTAAESARTHEVAVREAEAGTRLDRLLAARLPELSRSRLKNLILAGRLSAGGETIDEPSYRVKPGQHLVLLVPAATPARPQAQAMPLDILYEDDALIVIDKPAGLVVHPAPGNPDRTLVNALLAHCGEALTGIGGERRPGIVHRLDKGTSGVMVAAKTQAAHAGLVASFAAREIERAYLAVVWGLPEPRAGEIAGNIGRSPRNRKKMAVLPRGGRPARTRYRVLKALPCGGADGLVSLVECRLLSGRTHQIRVHMTAKGHPLLGDPLYGRAGANRAKRLPEAAQAALEALDRQALHARILGFRHPVSAEDLHFESEIPLDIKRLIDSLE